MNIELAYCVLPSLFRFKTDNSAPFCPFSVIEKQDCTIVGSEWEEGVKWMTF
jgi:hypothetical protein